MTIEGLRPRQNLRNLKIITKEKRSYGPNPGGKICFWKSILDDPNNTTGQSMARRKTLPCLSCDGTLSGAAIKKCEKFDVSLEVE